MNCAISLSHQTILFPSRSSHRPNISIPSSIFKHKFTPIYHSNSEQLHLSLNHKTLTRPQFTCNAANSTGNWEQWLPRNLFAADKVLKSISGATSSPICQFITSPTTFLHSVDSRIKLYLERQNWKNSVNWKFLLKRNSGNANMHLTSVLLFFQAWLLCLVVLPARSNFVMRVGLLSFLALLSVWTLPKELWMDQLGRVTLLSGILFIMLGLGADGVATAAQLRSPPPSMLGLPNIPASLEGYSYIILKLGPVQLTKKGLSIASTSACLTFTIFQSASLCLSTTTPEQLAFALQWYMKPLARFGVPVAEVILTLLLSLRFINLVFDEVRTVALGIVSRRINWEQLTFMETSEVFFSYVSRIFKNIFSHAEQITQAMNIRGFRGETNSHKIYFSSEASNGIANVLSVLCLVGLIGAAALSEYALV